MPGWLESVDRVWARGRLLVGAGARECTGHDGDDGDPEKHRPLRAADEILSADFTMHFNATMMLRRCMAWTSTRSLLVAHTRAFGGERWSVEAIVADEKTVTCRWRCQATDSDTKNPIDIRGADFFSVRDGRLAALHRFLDFDTLGDQRSRTLGGAVAEVSAAGVADRLRASCDSTTRDRLPPGDIRGADEPRRSTFNEERRCPGVGWECTPSSALRERA